MPDEFVSKADFKEFTKEMREELESLKTEMQKNTKAVGDLASAVTLMQKTAIIEYDVRYQKKEEFIKDANCLFDDPGFREKNEAMIKRTVEKHLCDTRDNWSKWIKFAETVVKIAVAVAIVYGGTTLINTQKSNQRAVIQGIERIGD
jgi:hypothetical protein